MPNGDDKNWVRLCATLDAFCSRFGQWPDRVRIHTDCFDLLRDFELGPAAFRDVQAKIELIPEDGVTFLAEGGEGLRLEYDGEHEPFDMPTSARDWLDVISIEDRREIERDLAGGLGDAQVLKSDSKEYEDDSNECEDEGSYCIPGDSTETDSGSSLNEAIRVSGVCERDLDLLFLEELFASRAFRSFTSKAAGLPELAEESLTSVFRSVKHSSGESDLELYLELADGQRAVLLIENKIDASFQPAQAERYRQRAGAYLAAGDVDTARTLLVAPDRYLGSPDDKKGFDARLSYEKIDAWYAEQSVQEPRLDYKRYLIRSAIEKGTLGYQAVADKQMTAFWRQYWEWAQQVAPQLNMKEPGGRPAGSTHIFFRPDHFPSGLLLVHKFRQGCVDLEFTRWGARLAELRDALGSLAPPETSILRISRSAAIRWPVPVLSPTALQSQEEEAQVGLQTAAVLLGWYRENEATAVRILSDAG